MRQNTIAKSKGSSSNISLDWDGTLIIKFPGGKQTLCFVGVIARPVATGDIRGQCLPNSAQKIFLEPRKFILKHNENNGMRTGRTTPQDPRIFIPDTGTHPRNDPCKKRLGPAKPPPHRCRAFPLLFVQMGYGFLCGLWVWRRRTNRRPCCPPMSNPSTSSWTAP